MADEATPAQTFPPRFLQAALEESLKLQSHYANLLNGYDGGLRLGFESIDAWIKRLIFTKTIAEADLLAQPTEHFWVNGIVAVRDKKPYVQLSNENGLIAQLGMTEARQVSSDILLMAARTEADAMIVKFFEVMELPENGAAHILSQFRDFRQELDRDHPQRP